MTSLLSRFIARAARYLYLRRHEKLWDGVPLDPIAVSNLCVELDSRQVGLRMYHGESDKPMVIYAHGGGFVVGNLETHDRFCRALSLNSGCSLISIDYRLAPEHTFPAAHTMIVWLRPNGYSTTWIISPLTTACSSSRAIALAETLPLPRHWRFRNATASPAVWRSIPPPSITSVIYPPIPSTPKRVLCQRDTCDGSAIPT